MVVMSNMCCRNELNLEKLCAKCAQIDCAKVKQVISDNVCSQVIWAKNLNVENEVANNLCVSGAIQANQVSANLLSSNSLCAREGTINDLCVDRLSVSNFSPFTKYRATINFDSNIVYTLGTDFNFNNIID